MPVRSQFPNNPGGDSLLLNNFHRDSGYRLNKTYFALFWHQKAKEIDFGLKICLLSGFFL